MDADLVAALRTRDFSVTTAFEEGMIERDDDEHLRFASARGLVLFSFNVRDFFRLHTQYLSHGMTHSGIILGQQQQFSIGREMRRILRLSTAKSGDDMRNTLEFSSAWD